jgi:hypothetical protein
MFARVLLALMLSLSAVAFAAAEPAISKVGNIVFTPTSTLVIELGGTSPGSEHDQIEATGVIVLNGTLQVVLINGFTPIAGQWFDLFEFSPGNLVGTFTSINTPVLSGLTWNRSQLYTTGVLSLSANLPGDFNLDGTVDAADYVAWRKGVGIALTPANYNLWRTHFGQSNASGSSAPVPEPIAIPSLPMLALFLVKMIRCR